MLTTDYYQRSDENEKSAIDAFLTAVDRLEPYGYHVTFLCPEDATNAAPHLTRAAARAAICDNRAQWTYLTTGQHVREFVHEVFTDCGLLPSKSTGMNCDDEDGD